MSQTEIRALRAEAGSLRSLLESLKLSVTDLRDRLELQEERGPAVSLSVLNERARPASVGSYTIIPSQVDSNPVTGDIVSASDHEARAELARGVGRFLRRCLDGDFRGTSGRSRLKLLSTLYLVLADFQGQALSPPLVVRDFATAARVCKHGSSCGRSIFVGFATDWEAKIASEEAGVNWPCI